MLTRIHLENFTVFKDIEIELSPGINIFIGENGTGKTHLLKVMYAGASVMKEDTSFSQKLIGCFKPLEETIGRLVNKDGDSRSTKIKIERDDISFNFGFAMNTQKNAAINFTKGKMSTENPAIFIPPK